MKFCEIVSKEDFKYYFDYITKNLSEENYEVSFYSGYYPKKYPCLVYHDWEERHYNDFDSPLYSLNFDYIYQDENGNWSPEIIRDWG